MSDARLSRTARMFDDPELGGDLLLVGLALARYRDHGGLYGRKLSTGMLARDIWPNLPANTGELHVKRLFADDARRYVEPRLTYENRVCGAPMQRREGVCGQRMKFSRLITDWTTGERSWLLACQRHVPWYDEVARENRETACEHPPLPAANCGGILARHIPECQWPKIWAWATNGKWVQHPESTTRPKPAFELLVGDGEGGSGERPSFGVVS